MPTKPSTLPEGETDPRGTAPSNGVHRPTAPPSDGEALRAAVAGLLRTWPIAILVGVVAAAGTYAFVSTRPATYTATAALLNTNGGYGPAIAGVGGSGSGDPERALQTASDTMRLPVVRRGALRRMTPDVRGGLASAGISVEVASKSDLVTVAATSRDPRTASAYANATVKAFLSYRDDQIARSVRPTRELLEEQRDNARRSTDRRELLGKINNIEALVTLEQQKLRYVQRATRPLAAEPSGALPYALVAFLLGATAGVGLGLLRRPKQREAAGDDE